LESKKRTSHKRKQQFERLLGIFALVTLVIAWVVGGNLAAGNIMPALFSAIPMADHFVAINNNTFAAMADNTDESIIGYVTVVTEIGYGGPMQIAVAADMEGEIIGVSIANHKETPSFLDRVLGANLMESLVGKSYLDDFVLGQDIDGISGATYTTNAVAQAVKSGSRRLAEAQLGLSVPKAKEDDPKIQFGAPEIILIGLFAVGYIGHLKNFKYKKQVRWGSLITGLVFLGFVYNQPLTIAKVNQLLLGYWPQWQTNLYWFLFIGGLLFVFTVDNKNPYCEWFCPFGAAQECLGAIGGAKPRSPGRFRTFLKWIQRCLAWGAILFALLLRNPGLTSYEIFGTLFNLTGSSLQFGLLGIILLASLFIHRPWCTYLCPIKPTTDLYRTFRNWILESWRKLRTRATA